MSSTFLKYIFIGVINTLCGYGIIFVLMYKNISPEISNFIGYFIGFFISYYLNKKYNFKSNNSHLNDLSKFVVSMGIAYFVNLIVLIICYKKFGINVYVSQVIAGITYTITGYFLSKIWVFKRKDMTL